jgi:hypothetical protein
MWTDPTSYRNVENGDENYLIWHLPAEKRFGFKNFYLYLKQVNFNLKEHTPKEIQKMFQKIFQVPTISIINRIYYLIKGLAKKVIKK